MRVSFPFVLAVALAQTAIGTRAITWDDVAPLREHLAARGIPGLQFAAEIDRIRQEHTRRVREGDLDHLVFYLLQSTRFTTLPPIEPALSAKALVDGMPADERALFLREARAQPSRIPDAARSRISAFLRAVFVPSPNPRLAFFRELVESAFPVKQNREDALLREYLRAMRFLYEKEFLAPRSPSAREEVAALYRTRGLSTDTAVEAGYLVYQGLGVLKSLDRNRLLRRVLIVGPGLDLAPRTGLREDSPPQSYQPWAVIDALLALGLSRAEDLQVVCADINPRVVNHLRRSRSEPPALTLASEVQDSDAVTLSKEYRDYFASLGEALGTTGRLEAEPGSKGRLQKTVTVRPALTRILSARLLDIVTERIDAPAFDLIIATNILPYLDDVQLMLALSNVTAMLAQGGVFLHNEPRPFLGDISATLGLTFEGSRQATIATVRGAPPLGDSTWMHRKKSAEAQ